MGVNGITNVTQTYDSKSTAKAKANENKKAEAEKQGTTDQNTAAVYEKKDQTVDRNKVQQRDSATIDRLMAESEKRAQNLKNLVEKMLLKQGQTVNDATDIYQLLREGKVAVDPATRAQAQKDIAEDGYWGVDQTSERLVSFAKALSGGDTTKADEMIEAVKKGYEAAKKAWGGELPEVSKNTLDAAISKLEAWRDSKDNTMEDASSDAFKNQAATGKLAE